MSVTLQDLRDKMYSILREDENDSTAYPLSLVDSTINAAYNSLMAGTIMEPSG